MTGFSRGEIDRCGPFRKKSFHLSRSRAGDIVQDREIIQSVGPDFLDQLSDVLVMNPEPCGIADGKSMQP